MIRVMGARIAVVEDKLDETTEGGIVIPGREKEPTYRGTVVAVGNGAMTDMGERIPVDMKVGDKVVYSAFAGSPINDKKNDKTYVILNERDVLAVFTEEKDEPKVGNIYSEECVMNAVKKACNYYVEYGGIAVEVIPYKTLEFLQEK